MAVGGNVAPSGAVFALGVGIDDLLAALAEAQTDSVNLSKEGVVADAVPDDEAVPFAEPRGLGLAPAKVVLPQALLLDGVLAVLLGIVCQRRQRVGADEIALLKPAAAPTPPPPFAEPLRRLVQAFDLTRTMVLDQGRQRLALGRRRLAFGEAGGKRFGQ